MTDDQSTYWKITEISPTSGRVTAAELWRNGRPVLKAGWTSDIVKVLNDPVLAEALRPSRGDSPASKDDVTLG